MISQEVSSGVKYQVRDACAIADIQGALGRYLKNYIEGVEVYD